MRKLPPLKSLYSFIAVAETGSMTDAAKHLNVSHSAVSQSIKALENQLNQPLFNRVGRHVVLNNAGQKYYRRIAPALEQIVEATEVLMRDERHNRLTLNMVNSLALHWWIPRVNRFQEHAPHIDVRISSLTGTFSLTSENVDIAIVHGKQDEWQDYYCEKLAEDELVLVCSPELIKPDLIKQGDKQTLSSILKCHPAIIAVNERRKKDWQIWCDAYQLTMPASRKNLSFVSSAQAVQATIRQLGIFVTHRLFVKDDIKLGLLQELGSAVTNPYQDYYFVCAKEQLKQESILVLKSWIKKEFAM